MKIFNIIISLLTLFFAMAGFFRGLYGSKYSIDIEHISLKDDRSLWLLAFTIANRSLRPVKVSKLYFYANGKQVNTQSFDPQAFDNQLEEAKHANDLKKLEKASPFGLMPMPDLTLPNERIHSPLEYSFYNPVEMPCIIHGDAEEKFSYYFSTKPDKIIIQFDRKMILSFKFLIIPHFSSAISINLGSEKTTKE